MIKKFIKDKRKQRLVICALIYGLALNAPRLIVEQTPKPKLTYEEIRSKNPSRFEVIFTKNRVHFFFIKPED